MANDLVDLAEESTKSGFILVSGTIVATIITAIASILVARYLGPEQYGIYSLSLVIPQIFFLITDFGLRESIIKFLIEARSDNQKNLAIKFIKYSFLIKIVAGTISFLFILIFADILTIIILNRTGIGLFLRIGSLSIIFQAIYSTGVSGYIGLDKTLRSTIITQTQSFSKAIISIILIGLGFGIIGAIVGFISGFFIAGSVALISIFILSKKYKKVKDGEYFRPFLKKIIKYGGPLYFSIIMIGFMPQFIDIILAFFTSDFEIGNFKATFNFILLISIVTQQVATAFLPAFSKLSDASLKQIRIFFNTSHKFTTMVAIPITVLLITFSNEIVELVYGSEFINASFYLSIYSFLYLLAGLGSLNLPSFFNGLDKTKETFKMNLITFLIVIFGAPFITSLFGVNGLIVTIIIGYTSGTIYGMLKSKNIFGISFQLKSLSKIYLIAFLAIIPSFLLTIELLLIQKILIGGILYIFLYVTLIPFTKVITMSEVELIKKLISKIKFLRILNPILNYQIKILNYLTKKKLDSN